MNRSDLGAIEVLTKGSLRPLGLMPRASNYTFLVEVSCEGETSLAVYKPRDGEAPLWDFPDGTLCRREVAAYALSRALGWPAVPPTVLRDGPLGIGSVQLFVEADPAQHYFTLRETRPDAFLAVAAFDVVANNADRKSGHCLLGQDETVWLVDHGVCFGVEPKLRTVIWDFAEEPVPEPLRKDMRRVAGELRSGPLHAEMTELLDRREVEASARRAETLADSGRYPAPGMDRSYPWPPV